LEFGVEEQAGNCAREAQLTEIERDAGQQGEHARFGGILQEESSTAGKLYVTTRVGWGACSEHFREACKSSKIWFEKEEGD